MIDNTICLFRGILSFLPGGNWMISTGGGIAFGVFFLDLFILLLVFAERRGTFRLKSLWHDAWGKSFVFLVSGTAFFQIALIFMTALISLQSSLPPVGFLDYGNGNVVGEFLNADGVLSSYPVIGKMTGEFFMELVSPAQKEALYLGFLLNMMIANACFYLFVVRFLWISFRKKGKVRLKDNGEMRF